MLDPFYLECGDLLVCPFRPEDIENYDQWVNAIWQFFSDEDMLVFIPEKRLVNLQEADDWLKVTLLNFHSGQNYVYFITDRITKTLLGVIDIIAPVKAKRHYRLREYPHFIEFYLRGRSTNKSIMTILLPQVVNQLRQQGVNSIGAVINRENIAAGKVLVKSGFQFRKVFDDRQDLYEI